MIKHSDLMSKIRFLNQGVIEKVPGVLLIVPGNVRGPMVMVAEKIRGA